MNVFSQLGVAVASTFDPKSFKKLHKVSAGGVALFFFFFAAIILLSRYVLPTEISFKKLGNIGSYITKDVPDFSYGDGILTISEKYHKTFKGNQETLEVLIDTDIDAFTSEDLSNLKYQNDSTSAFYLSKTNMMVKDGQNMRTQTETMSYSQFFNEMGIKSFDSLKFASMVNKIVRYALLIYYVIMALWTPFCLILFTLLGFALAGIMQAITSSHYTAGYLFKAGLYAQVPYLLLKAIVAIFSALIPFISSSTIPKSLLGWIGFIGGVVYIILVVSLNGGEIHEENTYNYQNSYPIV